ncbi:hypothetical protein Taro_010848 [Colocasia esculenta]|uniref:Retrotransposon gag domain-containing protein n=1 Tax=Colocasia esculenta TaxID=4460 RepID=A0A843U4Q5_COLES|nr:hypothetical protein [Colocasia esculenta]
MTGVWGSSVGDVLEREWPSRRLVRRLETLRHHSRCSLCHRTHTVFVVQHRDAPVPQGGTGKVLREFLQFQPPQFLGQPDPDIARAWLDAVERTFRSMECVPEERVQILWQEFVVSFERAFCPTYVRTKRLYQFLDLQQRDTTIVQFRARFVELGRYAPQIMADESLRTQQFVRGLRPELRQALIVARVTDLDTAYQTAAALEADTLRTRARSAEVQTQVVPIQPRQQQGNVQTTPKTTTSYASTSAGTTVKSGSRRKFRRDRRQAEQRQQSVGSVQQPVGQPSQQQQTQSQPRVQQQQQQAPVQQRQQTGGSGGSRVLGKALVRVAVLDRAGIAKVWCNSHGDFEGFRRDWWVVVDSRSSLTIPRWYGNWWY